MLPGGGLLFHKKNDTPKKVLTTAKDIVKALEDSHAGSGLGGAHTGMNDAQRKVSSVYYWNCITKHVNAFVSDMHVCFVLKVGLMRNSPSWYFFLSSMCMASSKTCLNDNLRVKIVWF